MTLLILGAAAVIKIYCGFKITFAYTMTVFTCAFGVTFVVKGAFGIFASRKLKIYAYEALFNIYYWLSVKY